MTEQQKQKPLRIVRPGLEVVYVGADPDANGGDFTGITQNVWHRRVIRAITSTGMMLWPDSGKTFSMSYDWEQLQFWRIYVVRRGASKKPGRSWEMVERHYLYRIATDSSINAYNQAARIARKEGRIVGPYEFQWEERRATNTIA